MRRGLWLPLLAILSVLLHGAAIARHHAVMLGSVGGHTQLLADLGVICSPVLATKASPARLPTSSPNEPLEGSEGGQANIDCPVCLGQVAAVILPAASMNFVVPERQLRLHAWNARKSRMLAFESDWPPGTGPPAIS